MIPATVLMVVPRTLWPERKGIELMRAPLSVVFRTDAGTGVGHGHLMRSAALASALQRNGADVELLLDADAWSTRLLSELRLSSARIASDVDCARLSRWAARHAASRRVLIVDRPMLAPSYVRSRRTAARADVVACFVDVAGAPGPVDVAMTGSAFWRRRDWPLLPSTALRCAGPDFLCIRPQLKKLRRRTAIAPAARRIVVTLGGGDPLRLTLPVVSALARSLAREEIRSYAIDVIVGPAFADRRALIAAVEASSTTTVRFVPADAPSDPSRLLARADLAIAAGGSTLYELAYLGVPTVSIPQTRAEAWNARAMATAGPCVRIEPTLRWEHRFARAFADVLHDQRRRRAMRAAGRTLIDGRGAERLARAIEEVARTIT